MFTIPTVMTLTRLFGALFFLPFFLVFFLSSSSFLIHSFLLLFFLALGITDFFDGYLARKLGQVSLAGKILDPLADKVLVMVTLVTLLSLHRISLPWVLIFIVRDFLIYGLREAALKKGFTVEVAYSGKCKTAAQMCLLGFIILNPYSFSGFEALVWNGLEYLLLMVSLILTFYSMFSYYRNFITQLNNTV